MVGRKSFVFVLFLLVVHSYVRLFRPHPGDDKYKDKKDKIVTCVIS